MGDIPAVRWLSPDEQAAWSGLMRLHGHLTARLGQDLQAASGLSTQDYAVLVALTAAPEPQLRAHQLGRELGWEKSRLSHHLARMEARGLIARQSCPADQRGLVVVLTESGRRAIEAAAPAHVESVRRWFIDLVDPGDLQALARIAQTVDGALRTACPEDGDVCDGG